MHGTSINLDSCTVTGNSASNNGGGTYSSVGEADYKAAYICNNTAGNLGGGAYCQGTSSNNTFTNCYIIGNTASTSAGGLYKGSGVLAMTNCAITNNVVTSTSGTSHGGGIQLQSGITTLTNLTISGNKANNAGGLRTGAQGAKIYNCIIWGNSASTNPETHFAGGSITMKNSLVKGY